MANSDHSRTDRPIAGRFFPAALLGRGGMGEVWHCRDRVAVEDVALKRVAPEDSCGPIGDRHRREFDHLTRLRHPSILAVKEYGIDPRDGARWFSSEVLAGPVSTELIGTLSLADWLQMSRRFLRALAFMHRNGWVHGDIKSDNIRLRRPLRPGDSADPVLLDFGLCQQQGQPPEEKILGTPHAMPPEQWLGERPDARGDIYSSGVLLYQWWCGHLPFEKKDRSQMGKAHLQEDPAPLKEFRGGLPEAAIVIIDKMLKKRPDDRPHEAGEVLALLERVFPSAEEGCVVESGPSLVAQLRYPGVGEELPRLVLDQILRVKDVGGVVLHLHRREGDRRKIANRVEVKLMSRGLPVMGVDAATDDPIQDVIRSIPPGSRSVVIKVDDPDSATQAMQQAMQTTEVLGCKLIWWLHCSSSPGGFLGELLAMRSHRVICTDDGSPIDLAEWLAMALPGANVGSILHHRLQCWGAGSPSIWERILIGRVVAGDLAHDGRRWIWQQPNSHPEDRWRDRVVEQVLHLEENNRSLLEALAIVGAPATASEVATVAGIDRGLVPSVVSGLVQKNWIRLDGALHWREPFQAEGVLVAIDPDRRKVLHERASGLPQRDALDRVRHEMSAGNPEQAALLLEPWFEDEAKRTRDAGRLASVLTPLVDLLRDHTQARWADLLGQVEDQLGNAAQRDRAWRVAANWHQRGTLTALRLARLRAHTTRRDGDPQQALELLDDASESSPGQEHEIERERILVAIERSRILRALARRGATSAPILQVEVGEDAQDLLEEALLERCRCALARGARLQAIDLARQVIDSPASEIRVRHIVEAQCLRARAMEDLRSLRIWSRWLHHLCHQESRREGSIVAGIQAAEASLRLGEGALALTEVTGLIEQARLHCRGQLPRALLLMARCESGAGWIRAASRCLEEALTLDGSAGIVAWEGSLLVAASEWAAGRPCTARQILEATPVHRAPHEKESIDVHGRHLILESRCAFSMGNPSEALSILDRGITSLRLRGTDRDLAPLRRERANLLGRLGQSAMAQTERHRIAAGVIPEPGTDPEPVGFRRARKALDRRGVLLRRRQHQEANRYLEVAALDALRLRAQPMSTLLTLERNNEAAPAEKERIAVSAWRRLLKLESREGHAAVLLWWARAREEAGDDVAGQRLRQAALREVDRWRLQSPAGTRWRELATLLGVADLASGSVSDMGGRSTSLA